MSENTNQSGAWLSYTIDLPFPVSANRLWRYRGSMRHDRRRNVCLSEEYVRWKRMADVMYLAQKRKLAVKTLGKCVVCIILSEKLRRPTQDGDNFIKSVMDWLQRVEIIKNDKLCDGGMWGWGDAPDGCRVIVNGKEWTPLN